MLYLFSYFYLFTYLFVYFILLVQRFFNVSCSLIVFLTYLWPILQVTSPRMNCNVTNIFINWSLFLYRVKKCIDFDLILIGIGTNFWIAPFSNISKTFCSTYENCSFDILPSLVFFHEMGDLRMRFRTP